MKALVSIVLAGLLGFAATGCGPKAQAPAQTAPAPTAPPPAPGAPPSS